MKILYLGRLNKKIFLILFIFVVIVITTGLIEQFYLSTLTNYSINFSLKIIMFYGFDVFFFIPDNKEKAPLMNSEGICSFEIFYFPLLSLIIDKTEFYRHQYIPLLIMILMGIIRFIVNIKKINYEFIFPEDLFFLFLGLIIPLIDSVLFFSIQKYMKYKFYSPFFIYFLMGITNSVLALIIFIIYMNTDCGDNDICLILSKESIIEKKTSVVLVIYSLINSFYFFIVIVVINTFSVFHYYLFGSFEKLILTMFSFSNYTIIEQFILIVTFIIEIFTVLIFIEIIILNFCGFNYNIKKNIIFRAENEIDQLEKVDDNDDISINEGNEFIELQNTINSSVYDD